MKNKEYREEAFRRWGSTDAYKESERGTAGHKDKKQIVFYNTAG